MIDPRPRRLSWAISSALMLLLLAKKSQWDPSRRSWRLLRPTEVNSSFFMFVSHCHIKSNLLSLPLAKAGLYAMMLFICLSVRLFVCRLWNLWSHSLGDSTWWRAGAYRIESDTHVSRASRMCTQHTCVNYLSKTVTRTTGNRICNLSIVNPSSLLLQLRRIWSTTSLQRARNMADESVFADQNDRLFLTCEGIISSCQAANSVGPTLPKLPRLLKV